MSKASVAQEPSMDEILASIRRIIETGEDRSGAPVSAIGPAASAQPEPRLFGFPSPEEREARSEARPETAAGASDAEGDPAPAEPHFETARDGVAATPAYTIVSSRADAASFEPAGDGLRSRDDDDSLTAALESELAASWGSLDETHRRDEPLETAALASAVEPSPPHREPAMPWAEPAIEPADATGDLIEPAFDPRGADAQETEPTMSDRSIFEPANSDRRRDEVAPEAEGGLYAPIHEDAVSPLASQRTGSLVSASFDELAHAIRSGELKSLETMAGEMLRPLLQEWLDDNLPRMVERLVREEIERMARGGRR